MTDKPNRRELFALGMVGLPAILLTSHTAEAAKPSAAAIRAGERYGKALVDAYASIIRDLTKSGKRSSKGRVWRELQASTARQEKAYADAVYNNDPNLKTQFKRNNSRAAIKQAKRGAKKLFKL